MLRIRLITLLVLSCFQLKAQIPVIHRMNFFGIGDSVLIFHKTDTSLNSFTVGAAGANVLWDFSTMNFNYPFVSTDTLFFISPAGTPFYPGRLTADYSNSNLCMLRKTISYSPLNNDFNYYFSDNDSITFIGHWANTGGAEIWEDHCTNSIKELSFPFSFPDYFLDSFVRYYFDMSGSDAHYVKGTKYVVVDGYGSLITPDGITLNNVLRIHAIETVVDSNILFGTIMYMRHNYRWYSSEKKGYILSMEMSPNNSTIQSVDYQRQFNKHTTANYISANYNSLIIYPNPNDGRFKFSNPTNRNIHLIEIFNSSGQRVYSMVYPSQHKEYEIDVSDNGPGIYFIKIHNGFTSHSEKVLILK